MSGEKKIRRRVEFSLKGGADSWQDLAATLRSIAFDLDQGQMRGRAASGGYSAGYSWSADEDESVTHESFAAALEEFLDAQRAAEGGQG